MLRPALTSVFVAVICGGFLWNATDGARAFTSEAVRRLDVAQSPRLVPAVRLEDMNERVIALTPQNGEMVLVEFIYTVCGDICQIAAGDFAAIRDKLAVKGADVRLISVSFDPLRDTPDQMRVYGESHVADGNIWTIARPTVEDLEVLMKLFGVTVIPDEWDGFQHNAAIHVIDGDGRFSAVFDTDAVTAVVSHVTEGQT